MAAPNPPQLPAVVPSVVVTPVPDTEYELPIRSAVVPGAATSSFTDEVIDEVMSAYEAGIPASRKSDRSFFI